MMQLWVRFGRRDEWTRLGLTRNGRTLRYPLAPITVDPSITYAELVADLHRTVRSADSHTGWREGQFRIGREGHDDETWQGTRQGLVGYVAAPAVQFIDAVEG
jgi:hypothetical protein